MASRNTVGLSGKATIKRTVDPAGSSAGDGAGPPRSAEAQYQLSPTEDSFARTDAMLLEEATEKKPGHLRRVVPLIVLATFIAVAVWAYYADGWQLPWAGEPGFLTASGTLEADEVLIASEVAGRIIELAQEGQSIDADAQVARLDDSLIQIQIMQAALAARQQLEVQAARYQLLSPISGIVTRVPMHIGEVVTPGQTVAAVADLSTLELVAYVLERDLGSVTVGQQVTVTADPFPGRTFRGVIVSTNPRAEFTPRNVQTQADRLNLVFGVKIRVENPELALKPGMPADVTFAPQP